MLPALLGAGLAPAFLSSPADGQTPNPRFDGSVLGPGVHRVSQSLTVKTDLALSPGAQIHIEQGRTLRLLGDLVAPVSHIFTGPGTVDLNQSRAAAAYPEWWGARGGEADTDSLPALQACIAAHPVTLLGATDYHISDTLRIERPFIRIWGAGYRGRQTGEGTRLIVRGGTADVVRIGPAYQPRQVNDYLQGVDLRWVQLTRAEPVRTAAVGLRVAFVLHCHIEAVSAFEHATGFVVTGAVRTVLRDCIVFRSRDQADAGVPFRGFHLDGTAETGLAGGNASLFLDDCNVSIGGRPNVPDPVGLLLEGAFADSFVTSFETAGVAAGIRVSGEAGQLGGRGRAGHANLHIRMPILDQCRMGIEITDVSPYGLIELSEPYVALAPQALAAIRLDRVRGGTTLTGGQIIGFDDARAGGNGLGLHATDSEGLSVHGLKLTDLRRPVGIDHCAAVRLEASINNPGQAASQSAIWIRASTRVSVRSGVRGKRDAFPQAVLIVDDQSSGIDIETTGLDRDAVVGGDANRVKWGERSLATPYRSATIRVDGC
jgi:hypothetical protein